MTKSIEAQVSQEFKNHFQLITIIKFQGVLNGITSEVLASVFESAQVKNILEKNANYLVEDSSNENQKNKIQNATDRINAGFTFTVSNQEKS